eukprot:1146092-Pelagomonas_calceolata.AAC.5
MSEAGPHYTGLDEVSRARTWIRGAFKIREGGTQGLQITYALRPKLDLQGAGDLRLPMPWQKKEYIEPTSDTIRPVT